MGLSFSWIAVRGRSEEDVFGELGYVATGRGDDRGRASLGCARLEGGWLLLRAPDLDFASPRRIADLSRGGAAIGGLVEEHVMVSGVRYFEDGTSRWSVIHDPAEGAYNLSVSGEPPEVFASIRQQALEQQEQEDRGAAEVDLVFDVPGDLAAAVCGYRPHAAEPLAFMALERIGKTGFLTRLFAKQRE